MSELSDAMKANLKKLAEGDTSLAVRPFSILRDNGLVEKTKGVSVKRGHIACHLTPAGHAAV